MNFLLIITLIINFFNFLGTSDALLNLIQKQIKADDLPHSEAVQKCTEFKDTIDSRLMLHVPCVFIRLMERIKLCELDDFKETYLSILLISSIYSYFWLRLLLFSTRNTFFHDIF